MRSIVLGIGDEHRSVLGRAEVPARVTLSELKFLVARYRLALGKIGNSVISAYGEADFYFHPWPTFPFPYPREECWRKVPKFIHAGCFNWLRN